MKEKLKDLCNSKRMTFHQVEQALGFGNGTLAKSDIEKISYMRIVAITSFFGVDTDYFLDSTKSTSVQPIESESQLISRAYDKAPEAIKDAICKLLDIKRALELSKEA